MCAPNLPPLIGHSEASSSSRGLVLPIRQIPRQDRGEYLKVCERAQELEGEVLARALATEPPGSRGIIKGNQVWVKFPNGELLALEIDIATGSHTYLTRRLVGPTNDVYATCEGKPIDSRTPSRAQHMQEGSYARIHYRLRGGAPGRGRQECFSFVEGRCSYGMRCLFSHDTTRVCCDVCGSEDHVPEECVYYGGSSYDSQVDPNALKEAERAAARNRTTPSRLRPAEPSHPPPKSILRKYHHPWSRWPTRQSSIWYGTEDEEQEERVEEEPVRTRRAAPPSPPKVVRCGARLRPRSDGSGKRPPTPPRSKRARPATSSGVPQPPPQVRPLSRREPTRRKELRLRVPDKRLR